MKRILLPLAWIYNLVTRLRNHLYNIGYRKSVRFEGVCVIGVGNLNMGGSGKTPVVEYLIRLLTPRHKVAVLSRGYGRQTMGFRVVGSQDTFRTAGDEPLQIHKKFGSEVRVLVAEDRSLAIPQILLEFPETEVIILDDAFQHRRVVPDLNILLTRFDEPFHRDRIFPVGWLRESRYGARRADVVLYTKSPEGLSAGERESLMTESRRYSGDVPVFFCRHEYGRPIPFGSAPECSKEVVLVTGIAQSAFLVNSLPKGFTLIRHFRFSDHHAFDSSEIRMIQGYAREAGASILTTEKDMIRLTALAETEHIARHPWFYLPVEIVLPVGGEEFDKIAIQKIKEKIAHQGA